MQRSTVTAAVFTLLSLLGTSDVRAQSPVSLGIAAGMTMPLSDFNRNAVPGYRILGTMAVTVPIFPVGFRFDAAYDHFNVDDPLPMSSAGPQGWKQLTSLTLSPTYRIPVPTTLVTPYLIAGAGAYSVSCGGQIVCESDWHFGWNGGVGFRFGAYKVKLFAEARYNYVSASGDNQGGNVQYVPITIGAYF